MSDYPLVSIVTGYYNRKENLKESVQSVLDQDYPNFEYIIFDDCSTDGTYELLLEFTKDPRFKLVRLEKNSGFTVGIIQAIKHAKGELIAVHGAGDLSRKNRISTQVNYLLNNPSIGIVSSDREEFQGDKRWSVINNDTDIEFEKAILYRNYIVHGDVMFRKSIYDLVGGYDHWITYAQDRDLWVRMRTYCGFHRIPEILYERGVFKESVSQNLEQRIQQRFFTCLSRERSIKGRKFKLLFRDKYQTVADEAIVMHYENKTYKNRPILLKACVQESQNLSNIMYYYFHWAPVIRRLLYKAAHDRLRYRHKFLEANYKQMTDEQIYNFAVLGKK